MRERMKNENENDERVEDVLEKFSFSTKIRIASKPPRQWHMAQYYHRTIFVLYREWLCHFNQVRAFIYSFIHSFTIHSHFEWICITQIQYLLFVQQIVVENRAFSYTSERVTLYYTHARTIKKLRGGGDLSFFFSRRVHTLHPQIPNQTN